VERILLERIQSSDLNSGTVEDACESLGIERRWLRDLALRTMKAADPDQHDRQSYSGRLRTVVNAQQFSPGVSLQPVSQYLRTPSADQWEKLGAPPQNSSLTWAAVHSVKGQEFPAVALVIAKTTARTRDENGLSAVDHWEANTDAEARRVLYVGASRAEGLLILAVHRSHQSRVKAILQRDGVPFTLP
jgi:DNA helicase-2/ATP-dependent DNA helicase PcrA